MSQHMEALAKANRVLRGRAAQLKTLRGQPRRKIEEALLDPPPELASYKLGDLYRLVPRFGKRRLLRALEHYNARINGHRVLHPDHRLRELTDWERREFTAAFVYKAPEKWRRAA